MKFFQSVIPPEQCHIYATPNKSTSPTAVQKLFILVIRIAIKKAIILGFDDKILDSSKCVWQFVFDLFRFLKGFFLFFT